MVTLGLGLLGACSPAAPATGEARLVLGPGDRVTGLTDGQLLRRGTQVRAVAGEPVLELSRGRRVALRPGARLAVGEPLHLAAGEVLVTGARGTPVDMDVATVVGRGAARVARGLDASVRVYEGSATIESAQRRLAVGALRQASVPALGLVPKAASWVAWDRSDAWDNRYLGAVIELSDALDAGSRGFATQARSVTAEQLADLVPGVPATTFARALAAAAGSSGEALVGGAIARVAQGGVEVDDVLALRAGGAAWGIVAVQRAGSHGSDAVRLVYLAIERWAANAGLAVVGDGNGSGSSAAGSPSGGVTPSSTATTVPSSGGGDGGSPGTTTPPSTTPTIPGVTVPELPVTTVPTTTVPDVVGEIIGGVADGDAGLPGIP